MATLCEKMPFEGMIELGFTPTEIKAAIIELLDPYFEHKDVLSALSIRVPCARSHDPLGD